MLNRALSAEKPFFERTFSQSPTKSVSARLWTSHKRSIQAKFSSKIFSTKIIVKLFENRWPMAILSFRKKQTVSSSEPKAQQGTAISMHGCSFTNNGIGVLVGDGCNVEVKNTAFMGNGAAIVAGTIDADVLAVLRQLPSAERSEAVIELDSIAKASSEQEREVLIKKSTLVQKLSTVANVATIAEWLSSVIAGTNSQLGLGDLISTLMG